MIVKLNSLMPMYKKLIGKPTKNEQRRAIASIPSVSSDYTPAIAILHRLPNWFLDIVLKAILELLLYRIAMLTQEGGMLRLSCLRTRFKYCNRTMSGSYYIDGRHAAVEMLDLTKIHPTVKPKSALQLRWHSPLRHIKRVFKMKHLDPNICKVRIHAVSFCCDARRIIHYRKAISIRVLLALLHRHTVKSIIGNLKSKRGKAMGVVLWHKGKEVQFVHDLRVLVQTSIYVKEDRDFLMLQLERSEAEFACRKYVKTKFTEADWDLVKTKRGKRSIRGSSVVLKN